MPSTSASDPVQPQGRLLVRARDLSLNFYAAAYRPWTWKEAVSRFSPKLRRREKPAQMLQVIDGVNLEIREGERVGILGVNGVGKTTLCRWIAGFYRPTSGEVTTFGTVRAIFDTSFGIQADLTGRENAALLGEFLYPEGTPAERAMHIEDALEFSELGDFVDMPFRLYSNGMQARLCLSLISCRPCDLLILDEVFDGADQFFRKKISLRILKMIEGSGAVLFVSHAAEQLRSVCNRLLILHQGRIAYDGPVSEGLRYYEGFQVRPGATSIDAPL